MSRSLRAAIVKAILTESLDTTEEYVIAAGVSVLWPSATKRAFLLKFSPILTSKIMWHVIFWYPTGNSEGSFSQTSKAGRTFFISLQIASHQRVSPFSSSSIFASSTLFGILTPNLWVRTQYFAFNFDIILFFFWRTCFVHHANAGSPAIRRCVAYSASCTGYEFLTSFMAIQLVLPSFHSIRISHPTVVSRLRLVPLRAVRKASCSFTSFPSVRWSIISWNKTCLLPSSSTWANILSAIALAARDALWPSLYSTSYILVSRIGFLCATPIGNPFPSLKRFVTRANSGPSLSLGTASSMLRYVSPKTSGLYTRYRPRRH